MAETRAKNLAASGNEPGSSAKFDLRAFLSSVGQGRSTEKYQAKKVVFRQGDPADGVLFIQSGKIELSVVSPQGKEGVIAMLSAGDFFGQGCLAGQPLRMSSARTLAGSAIAKIDKQTMVRVLREEPALAQMFTAFLLMRNIQIEEDLVDQLFNSSERRLARVLLLLANFGKRESWWRSCPPSARKSWRAGWERLALASISS